MGIPPNISTEKLRLYRILQRVYASSIKGIVETIIIEPRCIPSHASHTQKSFGIYGFDIQNNASRNPSDLVLQSPN